jgi:hypothetical protein
LPLNHRHLKVIKELSIKDKDDKKDDKRIKDDKTGEVTIKSIELLHY